MTMVSRMPRTIRPFWMHRSRTIGPAVPSLPPKRSFVPFFAHDLDAADETQRARVADQLVRGELASSAAARYGPDVVRHAIDEPLALDDLDVLQRDGGRGRMPRIGEAMRELVVALRSAATMRAETAVAEIGR